MENGYHYHLPAQNERLTEDHKEQGFCLGIFSIWEDEWGNTIFSDEKVFSMDKSGHTSLWKTRGTKYSEKNIRFR